MTCQPAFVFALDEEIGPRVGRVQIEFVGPRQVIVRQANGLGFGPVPFILEGAVAFTLAEGLVWKTFDFMSAGTSAPALRMRTVSRDSNLSVLGRDAQDENLLLSIKVLTFPLNSSARRWTERVKRTRMPRQNIRMIRSKMN